MGTLKFIFRHAYRKMVLKDYERRGEFSLQLFLIVTELYECNSIKLSLNSFGKFITQQLSVNTKMPLNVDLINYQK